MLYMSPEVFRRQVSVSRSPAQPPPWALPAVLALNNKMPSRTRRAQPYNASTDVFSLALLAWELLAQRTLMSLLPELGCPTTRAFAVEVRLASLLPTTPHNCRPDYREPPAGGLAERALRGLCRRAAPPVAAGVERVPPPPPARVPRRGVAPALYVLERGPRGAPLGTAGARPVVLSPTWRCVSLSGAA